MGGWDDRDWRVSGSARPQQNTLSSHAGGEQGGVRRITQVPRHPAACVQATRERKGRQEAAPANKLQAVLAVASQRLDRADHTTGACVDAIQSLQRAMAPSRPLGRLFHLFPLRCCPAG